MNVLSDAFTIFFITDIVHFISFNHFLSAPQSAELVYGYGSGSSMRLPPAKVLMPTIEGTELEP